ncbi:MAG: alcohol dehydrogenase, partial [Planctomycetota bacterium]
DDRLLISSGYKHGAALVEVGEKGMQMEFLWETKGMQNESSTCVLIGEHLYGFDQAVLKCMDLEGNEKWAQRGLGKGALSAAGERLIIMTSRGELVVAQANAEEFEELSRAKVVDGGVCWSMPILSGGRIYCRNSLGNLVVRDHRVGDR